MSSVINVLNRPTGRVKQNGFDRSSRDLFNLNAGELMVAKRIDVKPGDYIELNVNAMFQGNDVNTAAFTRLGINCDVYFVPNSAIWSPFNEFISTKDDKRSSALQGHLYSPYVYLDVLLISIMYQQDTNDFLKYDIAGIEVTRGALRLLDMLGYGNFYQLYDYFAKDQTSRADALAYLNDIYGHIKVNLYPFAAYQLIWYLYYRDFQYDNYQYYMSSQDAEQQLPMEPYFFNFDFCRCNSLAQANLISEFHQHVANEPYSAQSLDYFVRNVCQLRYRRWKKDMFTGLLPSAQYGVVSSVSGVTSVDTLLQPNSLGYSKNALTAGSDGRLIKGSIDTSANPATFTDKSYAYLSGSSSVDVLSLWKAEAIQRYNQQLLRAGNKTKDNIRAIYGAEPNYEPSVEPRLIGTFDGRLNIDRVTSTSATSDASLGQFGGNMLGGCSTDHTIKFKSDGDFGTILVICYVLPEADYDAAGLDKSLTYVEQSQFFNPFMDDLGLEPVHYFEQNINPIPASISDISSWPAYLNTVIGYTARFHEYKMSVDKVHMGFLENRYYDAQGNVQGAFSSYVAPRNDQLIVDDAIIGVSASFQKLSTLYVNPNVLGNIFVNNAFGSSDYAYQFLCDFYFDIKQVSNMSVLGLNPGN